MMLFLYRDETKELNNEARRSAHGSFIQLPGGITQYELAGDENSKPVILIHGFSVPYFIYDPTFEFLTHSGFLVLRFDLFGRGFSDRPRARYNLELFLKQLADLLEALRFAWPVNLIGLSTGGPIASVFTVRHPQHVDKLVLIDPVGAKPLTLSPMLKALKLPLVAEALLSLVGNDTLIQRASKDFFDPEFVEHFKSKYEVQMQFKGFRHAILSTLRNNMLGSFIDIYRRLGKMNKEVLLFWGRNDTTVPFEHSAEPCAAMPNFRFHAIENCGHIPPDEKPDEVNPILLEFLK